METVSVHTQPGESQPGAKAGISSLPYAKLEALCAGLGQPAYRAGQLFGWLHQRQAQDFAEMSNLPAAFRQKLAEGWAVEAPKAVWQRQSRDGTVKYLFRLGDGHCVESVLMRYQHGNSLCISSQVGCRMGCRFCASTQSGLVRGLTAGEMAGQVYSAERESGCSVSHIVLMGIGEPLDNFDNVMDFMEIITDERGKNLSGRNLSLSTCGLVEEIERLAEKRLPLTLSISLHAADDETRQSLMPVARRYPIARLLAACRAYQSETGRRISYEYAVVPGVNDRREDAEKLAGLLRGMGGHVNLIPVNPVEGSPYQHHSRKAAEALCARLTALGLNATVRRSLGTDIGAACGQLRAEHAAIQEKEKQEPR